MYIVYIKSKHVVTKDNLACFLDTQPIPETECTEYPTLSIDAEDAGDVVSLCTRSAKAGSTPQPAAPSHQVCGEMLIASTEK